jgi:5'-3' exonuclease
VAAAGPRIRHLLRALGIADLAAPGVEADDLIGTLAARGAGAGAAVAIVSPDRDFYQLLRPGVQLLRPPGPGGGGKGKGSAAAATALTVAGLVPYTAADFEADHPGLTPAQAIDVKALQGDPSDNVPGVPGVGTVWAARLVREHGCVEGVLAAAEGIARPSLRAALTSPAGKAQAALAKRLVTINTALDIPPARLPWADLRWGPPSPGPARDAARAALAELDLAAAAARLEALWAAADAAAAVGGGGGGGGGSVSAGVDAVAGLAGVTTGAALAARRKAEQQQRQQQQRAAGGQRGGSG